jgi:hypothetical protein
MENILENEFVRRMDCMFYDFKEYHPNLRVFSTKLTFCNFMSTSLPPHRRAANLDLCSDFRALEEGGIIIVPHLL